jgi:lysozyme
MQNRSASNVKVIDVSHHNGNIDWKKVAADGVKGAYIKLTEGTTYLDDQSYKNYLGAKNAGIRVGFYCFAHCTNDPKKEVDFFLKKLGKMKADLPHCLDLETAKGLSKAQVSAFGLEWLNYMERKTGIIPILYTGYQFAETYFTAALGKYPLWVARYSGSNRTGGMKNPGTSKIWSKWSMFQYTDSGKVNGIGGNVDINEMDLAFFKSIDSGITVVADANPPSSYRQGDKSLGVKELQQKLLQLGYKLLKYGADSSYGAETVAAVKAFQKNNGLSVDGIAGEKTLAKLDDLYKTITTAKQEEENKVDTSKLPVSEQFKEEVEKAKELKITNGSRPQDNATREAVMVMSVRTFEAVQEEVELEDYQKQELYKTFQSVKDKLPLQKVEEWEEKLNSGQFKTNDLIYLMGQLLFRSYE